MSPTQIVISGQFCNLAMFSHLSSLVIDQVVTLIIDGVGLPVCLGRLSVSLDGRRAIGANGV